MFPSIMAPKIPILFSQCEMDHHKHTILLIFSTLSLGGCGGHPMRPELNLKDKSQMSKPNEYTDNFKSNLICIFPSVRAKLKKTLCPRTLCRICNPKIEEIFCKGAGSWKQECSFKNISFYCVKSSIFSWHSLVRQGGRKGALCS